MTSTAVWFLLLLSSVLGYYAHHLADDSPDFDLESEGQRTPTNVTGVSSASPGSAGSVPIPLHLIQSLEEIPLSSDEPASISTIKYLHTDLMDTRMLARVADWLRWIGKSLAVANAIGIVANSIFQFAGVYDNCYCDSSVYKWGSAAFNVVFPTPSDIDLARQAWIGALALGLSCCTFFVGTIYLIQDSLPP